MDDLLDLTYPNILGNFGQHMVPGRLESRAFLAWFLEHFYRLDENEAQDTVCDGPDDKGIDGIYINANLERVDVFQTKLYQNTEKNNRRYRSQRVCRNAQPTSQQRIHR